LILASKVFSPQYLLFFFPVLALSLGSLSTTLRHMVMALTVAISLLTTWVYPYHEKELGELLGVATIPLIARNALFSLLVLLLQIEAWRRGRPEPQVIRVPEGMETSRRREGEGR
jgi:hypothetical protein